MNIVLLTSSLGSGGAERVASTLCNAWHERGDNVTLIATFSGGGQPFYALADGIDLIFLANSVGTTTKSLMSYVRRLSALRKHIRERKPDVVVSFLPNVNVAAVLATAGLRIPLIICERSDPTVQPYSWFWKFACKLTYRFADMLTVQTDDVAGKAARIFPRVKRIRSVANPLPAGVRQAPRLGTHGRRVLLSMGRLSTEKQVDRIIDSFAELAPEFADWDLHIYGEGPMRAPLEQRIRQYKLDDRVLLKGRTNEPWAVMAKADAFVMASLFEGFPNALLEAMGSGMPCAVFDCPSGPRDISDNGKNAILVTLNDQVGLISALRKLMGDDEVRAALGKNAGESVRVRYSLPAIISAWDQLFKEVRPHS